MAFDALNPAFLESDNTSSRPELLVSALLHLMSHYSANENGACLKLASVIERHLKVLADLPDLSPVLRATCQQLSEQWAAVVERTLPQPEKRSFLSRLTRGTRPNRHTEPAPEYVTA
ncbi:hypothetical protein EGT07_11250 [Herbaspirillum sp. HC18]|nr:hypothetical protein EGT07_11250 [Herbaspirillum sp. HC18]